MDGGSISFQPAAESTRSGECLQTAETDADHPLAPTEEQVCECPPSRPSDFRRRSPTDFRRRTQRVSDTVNRWQTGCLCFSPCWAGRPRYLDTGGQRQRGDSPHRPCSRRLRSPFLAGQPSHRRPFRSRRRRYLSRSNFRWAGKVARKRRQEATFLSRWQVCCVLGREYELSDV
jgi:hypothetical protein